MIILLFTAVYYRSAKRAATIIMYATCSYGVFRNFVTGCDRCRHYTNMLLPFDSKLDDDLNLLRVLFFELAFRAYAPKVSEAVF